MTALQAEAARNITQAQLTESLSTFDDAAVVKLLKALLAGKDGMGEIDDYGAELLRVMALPGLYGELVRRLEVAELEQA